MTRPRKRVSLALQGGGAHGAYTWGVLDRLLEEDLFEIAGITGASAGAINAAAVVDGHAEAGSEGARERLRQLWSAVAEQARLSPFKRSPLNVWLGDWSLDNSPGKVWFDFVSHFVSPYDFNPMDINPLRRVLAELIDFERIRQASGQKLFISATRVSDGKLRVFRNSETTADAVLASTCLPHLFKAVEIDGDDYWDGGYAGNPVLFPYLFESQADDVILVQLNPVRRAETPRSARQIADRVDEITFNASLQRELRALSFVASMLKSGAKMPAGFRPLRIHRIDADVGLEPFSASSKMNAERGFILHLHALGRQAAEHWLADNSALVGIRSSFDATGDMEFLPRSRPARERRTWRLPGRTGTDS